MIHVVAIGTAQPGQREAVLAALHENLPAVHSEAGCIADQTVVDAADFGPLPARIGEDAFMVLETWASDEALRAHAATLHMAEYGRKTKDVIASRVIHVLSPA